MGVEPLLSEILDNEALTRGLNDPEARILIEWLVDRVEHLLTEAGEAAARGEVSRLCSRGRAISRFVRLWCHDRARGGAVQLAATERFMWPLPAASIDPCELMQSILSWEAQALASASARPARE
jgi:hypothetical protein